MNLTAEGHCPWCGRLQAPTTEPLWRCSGCNLYLASSDLVRAGEEPVLDAVGHDLCPWCAFPVGREYSVPEQGSFRCRGCAGTLSADMLVAQADIEHYRKKPMSGRQHALFLLIMLLVIALAVWLLLSFR